MNQRDRPEEIELRVPGSADARSWFELFDDEDVMRYVGDGTRQDVRWYEEFAERQAGYARTLGVCLFAILADGEVAGFIGFQPWSRPWGPVGEIEMGWRLGRVFHGRGIAGRAGRLALARAQERDITDLVAMIHEGNEPSMALAERLGFRRAESYEMPTGSAAHAYRRTAQPMSRAADS